MWHDVLVAAGYFALAPVASFAWSLLYRLVRIKFSFIWGWWVSGACGGAAAIIQRDWPAAIGCCASAAVAIVIWWWRRKDRKRAASLVGAKSRALRDAIVKRARNASRGARPVLRPVPGGAR